MTKQDKIKNQVNTLYNLHKKNEVSAFVLGFVFGPIGGLYVSFPFFFALLFCQFLLFFAFAILAKSGISSGWLFFIWFTINGVATALAASSANVALTAALKLTYLRDIDE